MTKKISYLTRLSKEAKTNPSSSSSLETSRPWPPKAFRWNIFKNIGYSKICLNPFQAIQILHFSLQAAKYTFVKKSTFQFFMANNRILLTIPSTESLESHIKHTFRHKSVPWKYLRPVRFRSILRLSPKDKTNKKCKKQLWKLIISFNSTVLPILRKMSLAIQSLKTM